MFSVLGAEESRGLRSRESTIVRERDTEWEKYRGRDAYSFCRSEAEELSIGGGEARGECRRQVLLGSKVVSVCKEWRFRQMQYRLQTGEGSKKWFVVLNNELISWLHGCLQTAEMKEWLFPKSCIKKSGS
ncbi:unnamed protein product [Linum trigynum]|uniref:PH domain-containing protein n=1 Tax=Linum trigynum TaxID=586398 RepID=A0AAV2D880_9ROSI